MQYFSNRYLDSVKLYIFTKFRLLNNLIFLDVKEILNGLKKGFHILWTVFVFCGIYKVKNEIITFYFSWGIGLIFSYFSQCMSQNDILFYKYVQPCYFHNSPVFPKNVLSVKIFSLVSWIENRPSCLHYAARFKV